MPFVRKHMAAQLGIRVAQGERSDGLIRSAQHKQALQVSPRDLPRGLTPWGLQSITPWGLLSHVTNLEVRDGNRNSESSCSTASCGGQGTLRHS